MTTALRGSSWTVTDGGRAVFEVVPKDVAPAVSVLDVPAPVGGVPVRPSEGVPTSTVQGYGLDRLGDTTFPSTSHLRSCGSRAP